MKTGGEITRARRIRLLSWEEIALWRHATADVKARGDKPRATSPSTPSSSISSSKGAVSPAPTPEKPTAPAGRAANVPSAEPEPPPKRSALAPLAPLERRLKRQLSSGKAQVDDVIDLHGMTQAQAHRALTAFLWRSAENGAKLVLVITGKGAGIIDDERHAGERGVLRRNAPHWLRAPDLRAIVLSIEEAARPHGGAGALYVRLRRRLPG